MEDPQQHPSKRQIANGVGKENHDEDQAGDKGAENNAAGHEVKVAVKVGENKHGRHDGEQKVHIEPALGPTDCSCGDQSPVLDQEDEE